MWFFSLESVCPKTEAHDLAASPVIHSSVGLEGLPSWVLAPKTVQGRGMGKMCSLHGQLPREREKRVRAAHAQFLLSNQRGREGDTGQN